MLCPLDRQYGCHRHFFTAQRFGPLPLHCSRFFCRCLCLDRRSYCTAKHRTSCSCYSECPTPILRPACPKFLRPACPKSLRPACPKSLRPACLKSLLINPYNMPAQPPNSHGQVYPDPQGRPQTKHSCRYYFRLTKLLLAISSIPTTTNKLLSKQEVPEGCASHAEHAECGCV